MITFRKAACFWDYIKAGGLNAIAAGGIKNSFGWLNMFEQTGRVCHEFKEPHWYPNSLAVSLKAKGQGILSEKWIRRIFQ